MPASTQPTCGKWMVLAQDYCGRGEDHPKGACRSRKAMEAQRARMRLVDRPYDPEAARRWKAVSNVTRYGLTPESFAALLHDQDYACAMCLEPFKEAQRICVDHDHSLGCHPGQKQACDRCRRGLLCVACNTSLGHIEARLFAAQRYLKKHRRRVA
jgi:Recombination endonuclease VII